MTKQLKNELNRILKQIVVYYKPQKVILFGSMAWGNPTKDSDLDLLIIKGGIDSLDYHERYRKLLKMIDYKTATDFLIYTPYEIKKRLYLKDPFFQTIINKGKVLYGS